jgi:hypothetical protein
MEPGIFFSDEEDAYNPRLALQTCHRCPIEIPCLAKILKEEGNRTHEYRFGIQGGMTPEERASLARGEKRGSQRDRMKTPRDLKRYEIWDSGMSDPEAAEYFSVPLKAWIHWRERRGLPANPEKVKV